MTIEIRQPELEALILKRMRQGQSVEEIMTQAFGLPSAQPADRPLGWRSMRGMARGDGESLTKTLIKDRAAENAHDNSRLQSA